MRAGAALDICKAAQGGNSSLVGGSVPVFDEVIVSMASMNKIVSLDKVMIDAVVVKRSDWLGSSPTLCTQVSVAFLPLGAGIACLYAQ